MVNRNPSAFARYQEEQATAEREIKVSRKFYDTKFCSSHQSLVMLSLLICMLSKNLSRGELAKLVFPCF